MTDAEYKAQMLRDHTPLLSDKLHSLLLYERVVVEPASLFILQLRLQGRLRDKEYRTRSRRRADNWPRSVGDSWLQQEIDHLQAAIATARAVLDSSETVKQTI